MRSRASILVVGALTSALAVGALACGPRASSARDVDVGDPRASLGGVAIPLHNVASHHCHDRDYPVIRCFSTAKERDRDLADGSVSVGTSGVAAVDSVAYTTFYQDEEYGGLSFTAYNPIPDMSTIGWNDLVTSFRSLNVQRPRWYQDSNYGTPSWRWAAGAWVPNVGSNANDRFSSVENAP